MVKNKTGTFEAMYNSIWFKLLCGLISTILVIIFGFPALADFLDRREPVDITGEWKITFEVNESSYNPYIGGSKDYKIFFTQKNQEVVGKGESWEFESDLNFESHVPLEFEGKIDKHNFIATYTLYGTARTTVGAVNLKVNDEGDLMSGDFVGTAADAKGFVKAHRL